MLQAVSQHASLWCLSSSHANARTTLLAPSDVRSGVSSLMPGRGFASEAFVETRQSWNPHAQTQTSSRTAPGQHEQEEQATSSSSAVQVRRRVPRAHACLGP